MTTMKLKRPPSAPTGDPVMLPKLYIATPCYGGMATIQYLSSIRNLSLSLHKSGLEHCVELMGNESLITRARNKCVAGFLASDCTHLVFIDSDIGFLTKDLAAMVRSDFDVTVGAYPMKRIGWGNVVEAVKEGVASDRLAQVSGLYAVNMCVDDITTGRVDIIEREGTRFVRVEEGATGFMVIRRQALEKFIATYKKQIEYVTDYEPVGETHHMVFQADRDPLAIKEGRPARYLSEDYWFSRMWRMMGGEIYLNIDAQLTHTGTHRFEGDIGLLFEDTEPGGKDAPAPEVPFDTGGGNRAAVTMEPVAPSKPRPSPGELPFEFVNP